MSNFIPRDQRRGAEKKPDPLPKPLSSLEEALGKHGISRSEHTEFFRQLTDQLNSRIMGVCGLGLHQLEREDRMMAFSIIGRLIDFSPALEGVSRIADRIMNQFRSILSERITRSNQHGEEVEKPDPERKGAGYFPIAGANRRPKNRRF